MKFFKKRSVAVVVLVLAILASCAYGLYKKPADQLNVQYGTWLLDGAGVLSADTEQTIEMCIRDSGKGTGALRKAVHEILRRNKAVKSFRLGRYGEGEAGVTIVELK